MDLVRLISVIALTLGAGLLLRLVTSEPKRVDSPEGATAERPRKKEEGPRPDEPSASTAVGASARGISDVAAHLRELAKLREEGILTEEEYETKRKQLADEL